MGLLDLFSSDSKTSNSTTNNQWNKENTLASADNRSTDSGNIGGNVNVGEAGGDVRVTTTDYGAIDSAERVNMAALDFGSDSLEGMGDVSREAILSNQDVTESVIDLSGDSLRQGLGFGKEAIRSNEYALSEAMDFGREAIYESGDTAREVTNRSLDFGFDTFDASLKASGESEARAYDFSGDAMGAVQQNTESTIDTLADSFQFWNQQTSQNVDRSLAFADRANRSEGAAVLESGLKTVAIVGAVIGGTMVLREWAK